jgi:hypothetical protein
MLDNFGQPLPYITLNYDILPPEKPDGLTQICIVDFGPDGASFDPGITIVFNIDAASEGFDKDRVKVAYWDGSRWQYLDCIVDMVAGTVSIVTTHFTTFAVFLENSLESGTSAETGPPVINLPVISQKPVFIQPSIIPETVREPELVPVIRKNQVNTTAVPEVLNVPAKSSIINRALLVGLIAAGALIFMILIYFLILRKRTG